MINVKESRGGLGVGYEMIFMAKFVALIKNKNK